jgi:branched-chain amino acid transport system substrate-binding protein
MHLLAMAIQEAGSTDGEKIRQALENLGTYEGLIKTYKQPFTADNHDALTPDDYVMVHFVGNEIHPAK